MPSQNQSEDRDISIFATASFCGEYQRGNQHIVLVNRNAPVLDESLIELSHQVVPWILVHMQVAEDESLSAKFFHCGREITLCGSGILVAARALTDAGFMHEACSLKVSGRMMKIGVVNSSVGSSNNDSKRFYFQTNVLPYSLCDDINSWQQLLNQKVSQATLVGEQRGYCILELASETSVKQCHIDAERLKHFSDRGVIITALSDEPSFDYVVRYFAPQYGQYEDAATGSANAMLGNYWQERLGKSSLKGLQLSQEGGLIWVTSVGDEQRVEGLTKVLDIPESIHQAVETSMVYLG